VSERAPAIHLSIPLLPPSMNHLYPTNWRTGRRVLSAAGKAWHQDVAYSCLVAGIHTFERRKTPLSIELRFVGATYRRDLDNMCKPTIDALSAALGFDDRWIVALSAARVAPEHKGQVETRVILRVVQEGAEQ
jgi:Holliday junction resolvase RusA-like endonuclease